LRSNDKELLVRRAFCHTLDAASNPLFLQKETSATEAPNIAPLRRKSLFWKTPVISTTGKLSLFDHFCVQEAGRTIYVLVVGSQEICEQHADGIASHPQPSRH